MANSDSKIIAVRVKENDSVILDWYAIEVDSSHTFSSLFDHIIFASSTGKPGARFNRPIELKKTTYSSCKILTSSDQIEVSWGLKVKESIECFNSSRVSFELKSQSDQGVKNAFTELMSAQKKIPESLHYPAKFGHDPASVTRGDWRLKNDFISLLEKHGMGFVSGAETVGKNIVNDITDCIFYILPHLPTLAERSVNIPEFFSCFYNNQTLEQDYNDPSKYKNKVKALDREKLAGHEQRLFHVLTYPCMDTHRMKLLKDAVLSLATALSKYIDYLNEQKKRSLDIHNLPHPVRSPGDGVHTRLKHIPAAPRVPVVAEKYCSLETYLSEKDEYDPVPLTDFWPADRKKRYYYIQYMQLPFDVTLYQYSVGGPHENLSFVWKCPKHLDLQKANDVIHRLEKNIPVYHTRAMRKEFRQKFALVTKVSPSVMDEMYRYLTGDISTPSSNVSKGVQQRLIALIDAQDPDIAFDMRMLHEKKPSQFDDFFGEVGKFLQEYELQAVDDRRHGLVSHMAVAMSVKDLHEQICARLPPGTPTPSEEYLRLQFMPKNQILATAVNYTGRFPLKLKIQSRQFNMQHVDAHYAAALQKYLKGFAVKYRDNCTLLSVDDKNHIPVGEPGVPIATIFRGKKSVTHADVQNVAADHDTSAKLKLTPSVTLQVEIPDTIDGDFYNGQVMVTVKDTIFQPSNPLRHAAEMNNFLRRTGSNGQPIRLIFSDGGPDHRVTYPSVKLAYIAMFLQDDLDYLLAMRTAPHQSYRNWVERIMSILNLALQTVAIERSKMNDENEKLFKNLATMNSIRLKCEQNEQLKFGVKSAIEPVVELLDSLFARLKLKDKPFLIGEPATEPQLDELWSFIQAVDPSVERSDTQAKQLKSKQNLQGFLEHCTTSRKYFFLIRKCGVEECTICKPPRLDMDVFETLKCIPDPEPRADEPLRYKTFDDAYGTTTTEKFCPSQTAMLFPTTDKPAVKMTGETVRDYVLCDDCGKPRCIYSGRKLTREEKEDIHILKEEVIYTCGGVFVPEDHVLADTVMVQPNITCAAPIAVHYYGNRANFPPVCFICGSADLFEISNELKEKFQSVHPVCKDCKASSKNERTRGAKKIKK